MPAGPSARHKECVSIASISAVWPLDLGRMFLTKLWSRVAVVGGLIAAVEHLQIALPAVVTLKFLNVEHALCMPTLGAALRH